MQVPPASPFPGVFLLRVPLKGSPLKYLNSYLIPGEDGHLLIDTGWNMPDAFAAIEAQVAALDLRLTDVSRIVITHSHLDHYGLSRRLRDVGGARVLMHERERRIIGPRYFDLAAHARQTTEVLQAAGMPEAMLPDTGDIIQRFATLAQVAEPDEIFDDGDTLRHGDFRFQVIWTPGHSPGHVCLYEPDKKIMFSGDHVLGHITPIIGIYPQSGDNPLGDFLASQDKVASLECDLVLPGHGKSFNDLAGRAGELKYHHEVRNQELLQLLERAGRPQNPCELAQGITWHGKGGVVPWRRLPEFDQRLAVFEVMAHLAAMAEQGRLQKGERAGVLQYGLA